MSLRAPALAGLAVLLATVCGASAPASGAAPDATPAAPQVTGYALADDSPDFLDLLDTQAPALAEVGIDGVTVTKAGDGVTPVGAAARTLLARAHDDGLRGSLLVSNVGKSDFSPVIGARLLRDPAHVERVTTALASYASTYGFDAITVDLESLAKADGPGLLRFVTRLRSKLGPDRGISVDLMAARTVTGYANKGYLLGRLAQQADVLAVMAYDYSGPGWTGPGPVGPLDWQRAVIGAALEKVPARQVDLGVAGYGYSWPTHGLGTAYSPAQMRDKAARNGVTPTWHDEVAEWSATLTNETVLWWSDRRSYDERRALAEDLGLHGLAIWRLGLADSLT